MLLSIKKILACYKSGYVLIRADGGGSVACALANKSALVFPLPISSNNSTSYTGEHGL